VSMALQHAHVVSILGCVVITGEGSFKERVLSISFPLSLFDMFFMTIKGSRT